jgi:hypothetical protein
LVVIECAMSANPVDPINDGTKAKDSQPKEQKANRDFRDYFRFDLGRFLEEVAPPRGEQNRAHAQRNYLTNRMRRAFFAAIRSWWLWFAAGVMAAVFLLAELWWHASASTKLSNAIMAFCTIGLFAMAVVQWATTHGQLAQMQRNSEQAEETLRLMRIDQRPWLYTVNAEIIAPAGVGSKTELRYMLSNCGRTPATVTELKFWVGLIPKAFPIAESVRERIDNTWINRLGISVVPHRDQVGQHAFYDLDVSDRQREAVARGDMTYVLAGKIFYRAADDDSSGAPPYSTGFMFKWDMKSKAVSVIGGPEENYMK